MNPVPKLVVLGRDGTLNVYRPDHVKEPSEWGPIPGALEAVARLNHAGWHVVVATNQAGIGRGMIDMASLNAVHAHMMKLLAAQGGRIDAVFICPHTPEEGCDCRKPLPGLLEQIRTALALESLAGSWMVGDSLRDLQAGKSHDCRPVLVRTGKGRQTEARGQGLERTPVFDDLAAFVDWLLAESR